MKILYLTYSQIGDYSFGGAIRANAIRDALLAIAHVDTLVIDGGAEYSAEDTWSKNRVRKATFSSHGLSWQAFLQRRKLKTWVRLIATVGDYDVVVAQRMDIASLLPANIRQHMIFDPDDFIKNPPKDASLALRAKLVLRNFVARRLAHQSAHVWYSNPREDQLPPTTRRSYLPNVAVAPDAGRLRPPSVPYRLLMVGFFNHPPNAEGLFWFHNEVLPSLLALHPAVELHAIGHADDKIRESLPNVVFRGFVDDLAAEYDRATIVVAPILSGGGTQIKVLDALAHGRPLIASVFAHRGFSADLQVTEHLLVADQADEWVSNCTWAFSHHAEIAAMAGRGEQAVRAKYGQERLRSLVADTINQYSTSNENGARFE